MDMYLVGGAVRDKWLGRSGGDRDHVVVGASPEAMQRLGYRPVGKDFPVFLHPETHEEYALARTERKSGHGYRGFTVYAAPDVTLEQDLARRDLTINAMAEDQAGRLIDPYGGMTDLHDRLLRHVSPAFVEDPVRLLRVARFAARFAPWGFKVAPETMALLQDMVRQGEVDHLVPERVWAETRKALTEARPSVFLQVMHETGALSVLFPEVAALYGVPQRPESHPEIDCGRHLELAMDMAAQLHPGDDLVGYCVLGHDLGKALTPPTDWPRHPDHGQRGLAPLQALSERLRVPHAHASLASIVCRDHLLAHQAETLPAAQVLQLLIRLDAFKRPERLESFLGACEADFRGRLGWEQRPYPQADILRRACQAASAIVARDLDLSGLSGPAIGEALLSAREQAIAAGQLKLDES
ncbi:multifunctional CCA addition/repair protein [Frateuria aurantia]